jgi:hypothetical protein
MAVTSSDLPACGAYNMAALAQLDSARIMQQCSHYNYQPANVVEAPNPHCPVRSVLTIVAPQIYWHTPDTIYTSTSTTIDHPRVELGKPKI